MKFKMLVTSMFVSATSLFSTANASDMSIFYVSPNFSNIGFKDNHQTIGSSVVWQASDNLRFDISFDH